MSQQSTPETPWSTEPEDRGRRLAVILGGLVVVLLAVLGGCALLGGDSDREEDRPAKSAEQHEAEKAAEAFIRADAANAPEWCDLTTESRWWQEGEVIESREDCLRVHDGTDPEQVTVRVVRSISFEPQADGWGVEVALEEADGTSEVRAVRIVHENGKWLASSDSLMTDEEAARADDLGVDPIAVTLGVDTRDGAQ